MNLTNLEFVILHIISEQKGVSGYEIGHLLRKRNYLDWMDIRPALIYIDLNKLLKKKLVAFYIDTRKQGKGPIPKKFTLTAEGQKVLQQEILAILSTARERDYQFDLALAAIQLVTSAEAMAALEQRKAYLTSLATRVNTIFTAQGGEKLPINMQALYRHSLLILQSEIDFMDMLLCAFQYGWQTTS